jgi:hypothetical protein
MLMYSLHLSKVLQPKRMTRLSEKDHMQNLHLSRTLQIVRKFSDDSLRCISTALKYKAAVSLTSKAAQLVERSLSVMKDLGSNLGKDICSFHY